MRNPHPPRSTLELALRLIRYRARSSIVAACTGLPTDRIRKLTYDLDGRFQQCERPAKRAAILLANDHLRLQASLLAGMYVTFQLVDCPVGAPLPLSVAVRLCNAYDAYRALLDPTPVDFDYAWSLWRALRVKRNLQIDCCPHCQALTISERYALRDRPCLWCRQKPSAAKRARRRNRIYALSVGFEMR
jgi:hypothetical protein